MSWEWLVDALRAWEFRGKLRLVDSLVPKDGTRRARVHGALMDLDLSDSIQRHIYLGCVGAGEVAAVRRALPRDGVMIDAGANVGYFTALGARCVGPAGRVFAIEPSPYAFGKLEAMVAGSNLPGVVAVQAGLSSAGGEMILYVPPESAHNHSPTMVPNPDGIPVRVPVQRLDDLLTEWGVGHVDLLKIDVEGHEPAVFAGARRALGERRIRSVLCEFNDYWLRQAGSSPGALWQALEAVGFVDALRPGHAPAFASGCIDTRLLTLAR